MEPTFHSFFASVGGKPFYSVDIYKSSPLVIRSTSVFVKMQMQTAECGIRMGYAHLIDVNALPIVPV